MPRYCTIFFTARRHLWHRWYFRRPLQALTTILISLNLIFTLRWVIPTLGNDMVFYGADYYHNGSVVMEQQRHLSMPQLNQERLARAEKMMGDLHRFRGSNDSTSQQRLTIGIVASARPNFPLTQLFGHLSAYLPSDDYSVLICNTEPTVLHHSEEIRRFEQFVDVVDLHPAGGDNDSFPAIHGPSPSDRLRKEAVDYWLCLNATAVSSADYILLLEDDALPVPEFGQALHSIIRQLRQRDKERQAEVDYVKLYHPWKLRGIPSAFHAVAVAFLLASVLQRSFWGDWNLAVILPVTVLVALACYFHMPFRQVSPLPAYRNY